MIIIFLKKHEETATHQFFPLSLNFLSIFWDISRIWQEEIPFRIPRIPQFTVSHAICASAHTSDPCIQRTDGTIHGAPTLHTHVSYSWSLFLSSFMMLIMMHQGISTNDSTVALHAWCSIIKWSDGSLGILEINHRRREYVDTTWISIQSRTEGITTHGNLQKEVEMTASLSASLHTSQPKASTSSSSIIICCHNHH